MSEDTFTAYACIAKDQPIVPTELKFPRWTDDAVEMDIICCGVCGSDVHCVDAGWGDFPTQYPCVAGHEIVGTVTKVGKNVTKFKVGDRCGVGCQVQCCHNCDNCKKGMLNLCTTRSVLTFNDRYYNGDAAYGGFAKKWRGYQDFVVKIPDGLASEVAASFLCGGVTTYAPLKRYNVGPGSKVGVLGVGGLGHYGVQWAKAMGAEVIAFDVLPEKAADAEKLGCDEFVLMQKEEQMEPHYNTLTHILGTKVVNKCWDQYFKLLKNNGVMIQVDIPETPLSGLSAFVMCGKQITLAGTFIGSPNDIQECLDFAEEKGVRTWVNTFPMEQVNEAIDFVRAAKPRYRAVLMN